jgi:divalent metal cation (Fe/Co/Zn/Cd) transporter
MDQKTERTAHTGQTRMTSTRTQTLALSIFTVGYNLVEGVIAVVASSLAGSSALLGFGLDSFIESLSGMVMIWRFWNYDIGSDEEEFEAIEKKASRLVAYSFFILAVYVVFDAGTALVQQEAPQISVIGIALAIASLIVMPVLFLLKNRLGRTIGSKSLIADSKETLACLLLSVALLAGLVAFYIWRLWWIDFASALVIAMLILREGIETLRESNE